MSKYYAMMSPGQCGDWGSIILIDARVRDLIYNVTMFSTPDPEEVKSNFDSQTWKFLKNEFKANDIDDHTFVQTISHNWEGANTQNYYEFEELNSSISFGGISSIIKFVRDNNLEVIDDLS